MIEELSGNPTFNIISDTRIGFCLLPLQPVINCDGATNKVVIEEIDPFLRHPNYGNAFVTTVTINDISHTMNVCSPSEIESFLNDNFSDLIIAELESLETGDILTITSKSSEMIHVTITRNTSQWGDC